MTDLADKELYLEELRKLSPGDRLKHKLWCKATLKREKKLLGLANPNRLKHGKKGK